MQKINGTTAKTQKIWGIRHRVLDLFATMRHITKYLLLLCLIIDLQNCASAAGKSARKEIPFEIICGLKNEADDFFNLKPKPIPENNMGFFTFNSLTDIERFAKKASSVSYQLSENELKRCLENNKKKLDIESHTIIAIHFTHPNTSVWMRIEKIVKTKNKIFVVWRGFTSEYGEDAMRPALHVIKIQKTKLPIELLSAHK